MTQRNIAAWLAAWLANNPAQTLEDWRRRQCWLSPVPSGGPRSEGVLLTL